MHNTPYTVDYSARSNANNADDLFVQRWSPRSFKKTPLSQSDITALFNAARLAPSAYNEQPWRIPASTDETFDTFLELLIEFNQSWAKNASILGFFVAKTTFTHNGKPNPYAIYDCGAAWASMTFQARKLGLYTHGMAGIKHDAVYEKFSIDKNAYHVIAGFAVGVIDNPSKLSDMLKEREKPSDRKPLEEVYFPGGASLT